LKKNTVANARIFEEVYGDVCGRKFFNEGLVGVSFQTAPDVRIEDFYNELKRYDTDA
jgi:hypothetical protein